MNILFLTTYSRYSPNVFQFTLHIARQLGGEITLAHIYRQETEGTGEQNTADRHGQETQRIMDFAKRFTPGSMMHIPVHFSVSRGDPAQVIAQIRKARPFDLMIIGRTRNLFLQQTTLGDAAAAIIDASPAPVLIVPPQVQFLGIENMVYLTDFQNHDLSIIPQLLEWRRAFEGRLHLLHVSTRTTDYPQARLQMENWREVFSEQNDQIFFRLLEGGIDYILDAYLEWSFCDLFALHAQWRDLLSRQSPFSQSTILASKIPILFFK